MTEGALVEQLEEKVEEALEIIEALLEICE
jgi:hypothetical protein